MPRYASGPIVAAVLTAVGLLSGCSQEASSGAAPGLAASGRATVAPAATSAPAPSTKVPAVTSTMTVAPARLTVAAAGKRYLEITRPYNEMLEAFERGFNAGESVSKLQRRAQAVAGAAVAEATVIGDTAWPVEVEKLAGSLEEIDRSIARGWLAVASAESRDAMVGKLDRLPSGAEVGARIRTELGLPKYEENDY